MFESSNNASTALLACLIRGNRCSKADRNLTAVGLEILAVLHCVVSPFRAQCDFREEPRELGNVERRSDIGQPVLKIRAEHATRINVPAADGRDTPLTELGRYRQLTRIQRAEFEQVDKDLGTSKHGRFEWLQDPESVTDGRINRNQRHISLSIYGMCKRGTRKRAQCYRLMIALNQTDRELPVDVAKRDSVLLLEQPMAEMCVPI